jgi:hypothetical protein
VPSSRFNLTGVVWIQATGPSCDWCRNRYEESGELLELEDRACGHRLCLDCIIDGSLRIGPATCPACRLGRPTPVSTAAV